MEVDELKNDACLRAHKPRHSGFLVLIHARDAVEQLRFFQALVFEFAELVWTVDATASAAVIIVRLKVLHHVRDLVQPQQALASLLGEHQSLPLRVGQQPRKAGQVGLQAAKVRGDGLGAHVEAVAAEQQVPRGQVAWRTRFAGGRWRWRGWRWWRREPSTLVRRRHGLLIDLRGPGASLFGVRIVAAHMTLPQGETASMPLLDFNVQSKNECGFLS